jgi:hypothetical protein
LEREVRKSVERIGRLGMKMKKDELRGKDSDKTYGIQRRNLRNERNHRDEGEED